MKTNSEVAQQKDTADPQTAQKILAITLAFNEAAGKSDAAAIAALFTEDGVFVTDTGPVYGRRPSRNGTKTCSSNCKSKSMLAYLIKAAPTP